MDKRKQSFEDSYNSTVPVGFKENIFDDTEYVTDDCNRKAFQAMLLPLLGNQQRQYVEVGTSFGNTTMAVVHGMSVAEIKENWKDEESCKQLLKPERIFPCSVTAIDLSQNALDFGHKIGLYDTTICSNLNNEACPNRQAVSKAVSKADVFVLSGTICYLNTVAVDMVLKAFCSNPAPGFVLVNFMNLFDQENVNSIKRNVLKHLNFIGSMPSKHRKLSPSEKERFPDEEWVMNETWILARHPLEK